MKDNVKPILLTTAGILLAFALMAGWSMAKKKWAARQAAASAAAAERAAAAAAAADDAADA